ncbi:MAG: hypothetical protein JST63_09130 [Bacteroidetes bacterium]|nr:hypothetical protein [Bacteroidota bacterium]
MELKINVANPDAITYSTEELGFTILGGIRLDGLDRMRVTMKIEVINRKLQHYLNNPELANLALRHNLDLYNDVHVEKLIRKAAERLEVGTSQLAKAIADITSQLELYRLQQIEQQQKAKGEKIKLLTDEERKAAIEFLQAPNLMQRTNELIGKSGVIGEMMNRLLMYLIFTSRKTASPLHIISFGSSGAGKSHLQEKVGELIPTEDKIEITTLSENAFYYFGQTELRHKLILIEDMDGAEAVLYPLRELKSKKRITKTVTIKDKNGATKTIHLTVEGPVTIAGCTTQESVYEDNANRSFLIYIDESNEQDEAVMMYQRKRSAGSINVYEEQTIKAFLQNTQRVLQPITVRNPYAELLKIPTEVFKPRRTNAHYLAFIEAATFYHQYQREQKVDEATGEIYIETTLEDIAEANKLMKEILLRKSDELIGACRNYFERLKQMLQEQKQTTFTNREIRKQLRLPGTTVRRYHSELLQNGYIKLAESKKKKGYLYEIVSYEEYEQLQQSIVTVLDEILTTVKATKPPVSQNGNGSMKRKAAKALSEVSQ